MPDKLLNRAIGMHWQRLDAAGGEPVTYRRGSSTVTLQAVRASGDIDEETAEGEVTTSITLTDFIVDANALRLGGTPIQPDRGDLIEDVSGDLFEVQPGTSPAASKPNDGRAALFRIRTVRRVRD